jgi:hypothetical protein
MEAEFLKNIFYVSFRHQIRTLKFHLLHFLELYPPSNTPLAERRAGTAWESSEPEENKMCFSAYLNLALSLATPSPTHTFSSSLRFVPASVAPETGVQLLIKH